ncbi:MAG: hypothetical protein CML06_21040 [Pseudomonadales bacterium]|nr:hypothetical protein [Pseudomonadales bacterium]
MTADNEYQELELKAEIEEMMLSPAYKNANHPRHKFISKRVREYFETQNPGEPEEGSKDNSAINPTTKGT